MTTVAMAFEMTEKPYKQPAEPKNPRLRAGVEAERQMAHYLHRRFHDDLEIHLLHGLRLEDPKQPEQGGSPGVCQIDHLIVHRWGMFIIESKSVSEEIRVRPDDTGGDEWSRVYQRREIGMASPIRQAGRQSEFLRTFLERHRGELFAGQSRVLRTLANLLTGKDHGGFEDAPIQIVIAVSDRGRIRRLDGWKEPQEPFAVFVTKADLVPDKIEQELRNHRSGAKIWSKSQAEYGLWDIEDGGARAVAEFLAARHVERLGVAPTRMNRAAPVRGHSPSPVKPAPGASTGQAVCRHCRAKDLTARSGPYGYYWRCGACGQNTPMPKVCPRCRAAGRVRKQRRTYSHDCKTCDTSQVIWTER